MFKIRLRVIAVSLAFALAALGAWYLGPASVENTRPSLASGIFTTHHFEDASYLLYVPPNLPADRPATILIALHGMGAQPESFGGGLISAADRNGWVLVVPHLPYGDWTQPDPLKAEEKKLMSWLNALVGALPDETGLALDDRVFLYGFSRGAQLAHRFALAYPQRVAAAAIMSPGTYTLPVEHSAAYDNHAALNFPVGVNDIDSYCGRSFDAQAVRRIPFWIGVGEKDNVPGDVPRQWDHYLGSTRVERARSFAASLEALGGSVYLTVFPGLAHAESVESRASAVAFLEASDRALAPARSFDDGDVTNIDVGQIADMSDAAVALDEEEQPVPTP
ncbi:MAG TPA: alpha/beta fold hydrolase [Chloroflexota bacterium]